MSPYTTTSFPFIASVNCRRRGRANTPRRISALSQLPLLVGSQQPIDVEDEKHFVAVRRNRHEKFAAEADEAKLASGHGSLVILSAAKDLKVRLRSSRSFVAPLLMSARETSALLHRDRGWRRKAASVRRSSHSPRCDCSRRSCVPAPS